MLRRLSRSLAWLVLLPAISHAWIYKPVLNAQTGRPDLITPLSTSTIQGGSGITVSTTSSGVTISASGAAASNLAVNQNGVQISSPTSALNFIGPPFSVTQVGGTTAQVTLNPSSVTLQGQNVIDLTSTLQSGATFFVSSGTVQSNLNLPYISSSTFLGPGYLPPLLMGQTGSVQGVPNTGFYSSATGQTIYMQGSPDLDHADDLLDVRGTDGSSGSSGDRYATQMSMDCTHANCTAHAGAFYGTGIAGNSAVYGVQGKCFGNAPCRGVEGTAQGVGANNYAGWFTASGASTNYGLWVDAGNENFQNLTASMPVQTDASKNLVSSQISLSSAVTGTLPAGNMVSTAAFTNSTMTWTAGQTFVSSVTHSGSVVFSSNVVLSNGQGTAGQVYTTGVSGAPSWTTPSGGGTSSLAVTTGTSSGFTGTATSSPTAVILFNSATFSGALQGSATYFVTPLASSVTLQGQNVIQLGESLQSGATFFTSSGTVQGQYSVISPAASSNASTDTLRINMRNNSFGSSSMAWLSTSAGGFNITSSTPGSGTITNFELDNVLQQTSPCTTTGGLVLSKTGGGGTCINGNDVVTSTITATNKVSVTGAAGANVTYGISVGSMTASSATLSGQFTAGTYQGASLAACGDATHALSWSAGSFGCQAITSSGGSSSLAVTTGTITGFTSITSSPTAAINFDNRTTSGTLTGSATYFFSLLPSSVTLQGNTYSIANIAVDTGTLAVSTGTLYTLANGKINFSSITATIPITWNNATGVIASQLISLSTGVTGTLPTGNMVSTVAYTNSTNTWTGGNTYTSSSTYNGAVLISTTVILGGSTGTNGQVFTSAGQGASASWTTVASGGASALAISSGSATNSVVVSSPTSNVVLDSNTFVVSLQGTTSSYVTLNSTSVASSLGAGNLSLTGYLTHVAMQNAGYTVIEQHYAYVTAPQGRSIAVFDVAVASAPVFLSITTTAVNGVLDGAEGAAISGKYLFVVSINTSQISAWDISKPANPTFVSTLKDTINLTSAEHIVIQGNYAYVLDENSAGPGQPGFTVVDISNPAAMVIVGSVHDANLNTAIYMSMRYPYAYVTPFSGCVMSVVDVSTPSSPSLAATLSLTGCTGGMVGSDFYGKYLYVMADRSIFTVDVSSPLVPVFVSSVPTNGGEVFYTPRVLNGNLYAASPSSNTLSQYSLTNPGVPSFVRTVRDDTNLNGPDDIQVDGNYLYVTTHGNGSTINGGIAILNSGGLNVSSLRTGSMDSDYATVSHDLQVNRIYTKGLQTYTVGALGEVSGYSLKATSTSYIAGSTFPFINNGEVDTGKLVASTNSYIAGSTFTFRNNGELDLGRIVWADGTVQISSPSSSGSGTPNGGNFNVQISSAGAFAGVSGFNVNQSSIVISNAFTTYTSTLNVSSSMTVTGINNLDFTSLVGILNTQGISGSTMSLTAFNATTTSATVTGATGLLVNTNVTASTLTLTQAAAPTAPGLNAIWNDSAYNALASSVAATLQNIPTTLFAIKASSKTDTTSTSVNWLGTGDAVGTLTLPPNFFTVGKTIYIVLVGTQTRTGTPTLTPLISLGGTTILSTGAITMGAYTGETPGQPWMLQVELTCYSTGSSAVIGGMGTLTFYNSDIGGTSTVMKLSKGSNTINTATAQALQFTTTWGSSSVSNSITIMGGHATVLY